MSFSDCLLEGVREVRTQSEGKEGRLLRKAFQERTALPQPTAQLLVVCALGRVMDQVSF